MAVLMLFCVQDAKDYTGLVKFMSLLCHPIVDVHSKLDGR